MKTRIIWNLRCAAFVLLGCLLETGCTKYDTPPAVEVGDEQSASRQNINKYVLWVNLEGAGGGDLAKNAFPDDGAVKSLLSHSRYAWDGMELEHADGVDFVPSEENVVACASLLTGNMPVRHGIQDDTYITEQYYDPDTEESIKDYPGFFQYIVDYDKNMATSVITPWRTQNNKLLFQAKKVKTTSNDEETLNEALKQLNEESNRITYLSFRSVLDAGKNGGWQESNANYKEAIVKMDNYIGQLLAAMKARSTYYFEDWLVIITSNHGGKADGTYGGMSPEERQMFGIVYYEHLSHPFEMNPGYIEDEVMRFDKSFQGVVVDSITRIPQLGGVERMRQIYSLDSVSDNGRGEMTVEYVMASRPARNRSYVVHSFKQAKVLTKRNSHNKTLWKDAGDITWSMRIENEGGNTGFNAAPIGYFFQKVGNYSDGTWKQRNGGFLNPYIHVATTTVKMLDMEGAVKTTHVEDKYDQWGNLTPGHDTYSYKRSGAMEIASYYDGEAKLASGPYKHTFTDVDASKFVDNNNLVLEGGLYNQCRYILEIRIWNRRLSASEIKQSSNMLKIQPSDPLYTGLIGYWQFYKNKDGIEYLHDDSLVVNQIKTVKKWQKKADGTGEEEVELNTEPLRIRKLLPGSSTAYTNVEKGDISYMKLANSMPQAMNEKGHVMDSSQIIPVILKWFGIDFPLETTSKSGSGAFRMSKLDGIIYRYNVAKSTQVWDATMLGEYAFDLEWRDNE